MAIDLTLGIDVGTTSVKAALLDDAGRVVAQFAARNDIDRPAPGRAEQDPEGWLAHVAAALDSFAARGLAGRVSIAGLTSQVNTHVFVDAEGRPLMPAILWQDTRASAEAAELDAAMGDRREAWFGAPMGIDASHPLARMLWVARHHPDIWERTAHVLLPRDYAILRLTGTLAADPLSNYGLVGADGRYVAPALDLVPGAAERVAPLRPITARMGELRHTDFGHVPLVAGTMDGWAGVLGAGAAAEGRGVYLSGTSEILGLSSRTVTGAPGVVVLAEAEGLRFHAAPTQSGGASVQWFCRLFGLAPEEMSELAAGAAPARHLFLPQLEGERAPLWDANLRGGFLGLDSATDRSDLARAVFEGVAYSARHALEALAASGDTDPETLTCGGGGFRSDLWGQIRADVLNRPLARIEANEPGILGAAALAVKASGEVATLAEAHARFARYDRTWEPDPERAAAYGEAYALYRETVAANAPVRNGLPGLG